MPSSQSLKPKPMPWEKACVPTCQPGAWKASTSQKERSFASLGLQEATIRLQTSGWKDFPSKKGQRSMPQIHADWWILPQPWKTGHRKAMLSNMASSLLTHKRIFTTTAKAKALRVYVEPLITKSKDNTTHSRRVVFSYLKSKEVFKMKKAV